MDYHFDQEAHNSHTAMTCGIISSVDPTLAGKKLGDLNKIGGKSNMQSGRKQPITK
jgi:hypothetical protein